MEEALDGDYQLYKSRDGAFVREHFFGTSPELAAMVADWSDEEIWQLNRGGHDPLKVRAAYQAAVEHTGQPTVILAKTIKGHGMGESGEGQNITHQQKKMSEDVLKAFRTRFDLPLSDEQVHAKAFVKPADDTPEMRHLLERRAALGGSLPQRRGKAMSLPAPELSAFKTVLDGAGEREISTTMAFVRVLASVLRDKTIGPRVVPIVADESRTFGMEGMFRQLGIFSQVGQLYDPEDAGSLMFYKEDKKGQILQEGINEAGAMSSWIAAATSYSNHGEPMVPFYVYYSMFGFQRIGDLAWAAGDSRSRGFLIGGTSGRTTPTAVRRLASAALDAARWSAMASRPSSSPTARVATSPTFWSANASHSRRVGSSAGSSSMQRMRARREERIGSGAWTGREGLVARGMLTTKRVPWPVSLVTEMSPPSCATSFTNREEMNWFVSLAIRNTVSTPLSSRWFMPAIWDS